MTLTSTHAHMIQMENAAAEGSAADLEARLAGAEEHERAIDALIRRDDTPYTPPAPAARPAGGTNPEITAEDVALVVRLFSDPSRLDEMARKHTASKSLVELVVDPRGIPTYRPSIYTRAPAPPTSTRLRLAVSLANLKTRLAAARDIDAGAEKAFLADAYDIVQAHRNDSRRAYRG